MSTMMGIITNTKSEDILGELTQHRSMSAVPFGCRYRLIDFPLSNMVNSGIKNIAVVMSNKSRALLDHLNSGKEWSLDRKSEGLFLLPSASPRLFQKKTKFDLKDLWENFDFLQRSRQKYVVLSGNNVILNANYQKGLQYHKEMGADVTLHYKEEGAHNLSPGSFNYFEVKENGRVTSIHSCPSKAENNKVSLETIILERSLLMEIVKLAADTGNWDLGDVLVDNINELKVFGYPFKGYAGKINSLASYFRHSMELLQPQVQQELFFANGPIYTKTKDGPPVKYTETAETANVLVGSGCYIEGKVENSLLFRGVAVGRGSLIRKSIIMQNCTIEENVVLENVILDKDVFVRKGTVLKGEEGKPVVIGKRTVI